MSGGTREKRKQAEDRGSAQRGRPATHEGSLEQLGESGKSEESSNTDNYALVCYSDRHDLHRDGGFSISQRRLHCSVMRMLRNLTADFESWFCRPR